MIESRPSPNRSAQLAPWLLPVKGNPAEKVTLRNFAPSLCRTTIGSIRSIGGAPLPSTKSRLPSLSRSPKAPLMRSPASVEAEFAVLHRKRTVAIVVINPERLAIVGAAAGLHGLNDVFVVRPHELRDVQPAVVIVVAPCAEGSNAGIGQAGLRR